MSRQPPDKSPSVASTGPGAQREIATRPEGNACNVPPQDVDALQRSLLDECGDEDKRDATTKSLGSQTSEEKTAVGSDATDEPLKSHADIADESNAHDVPPQVDVLALQRELRRKCIIIKVRDATIKSLYRREESVEKRAKDFQYEQLIATRQKQQIQDRLTTTQQHLDAAQAALHLSNNKLAEKTSALMSAEEDVADKVATIAHLHEELLLEGNDAFVAMPCSAHKR